MTSGFRSRFRVAGRERANLGRETWPGTADIIAAMFHPSSSLAEADHPRGAP
jgi:hypothetical protein